MVFDHYYECLKRLLSFYCVDSRWDFPGEMIPFTYPDASGRCSLGTEALARLCPKSPSFWSSLP